jgi:molecular chaperone DnaK (HSP70)
VRITIECNSRLIGADFTKAIIDHFINSFGISQRRNSACQHLLFRIANSPLSR